MSIPATKLKYWPLTILCLALIFSQCPLNAAGGTQATAPHPWIVAARLIRNREQSASAIYLNPGLVITAAHLTAGWTGDSDLSVHIAGHAFPASLIKQGEYKDVDLALFSVDQRKLPESVTRIQTAVCQAALSPGDPVIIVDYANATRSHILSAEVLPAPLQGKYTSLIADVATTGNSGSGVFDPNRKCLLGIMSAKFTSEGKDIAKYFVPVSQIHDFIPLELRSQVLMK